MKSIIVLWWTVMSAFAFQSGQLEILIYDKKQPDGSLQGELKYYLDMGSNRIELSTDEYPEIASFKHGSIVDLSEGHAELIGGPVAEANINGDRSYAFIIVDFTDFKASNKYTFANIESTLFTGSTNMADFIEEVSFGRQRIIKDADKDGKNDIFTVSVPVARTCDLTIIRNNALEQLRAQGVDTTNFQNFVYILDGLNCGWAGVAYIGWIHAYVQSATSPFIYAHELGHNWGMLHSNKPPNGEYQDHSCPMGGGWNLVQYNAPQTLSMNWHANLPGYVKAITSSGDQQLKAHASDLDNGSIPAVLTYPTKDGKETYYISYRQKINKYENRLKSEHNQEIQIHRKENGLHKGTYLYATLSQGQEFYDEINEFKVVASSIDSSSQRATVSIDLAGQPCVEKSPQLALDSSSKTRMGSGSVDFKLTIKNIDSGECDSRNHALSFDGENLESNLPKSVSLAQGQSKQISFSVGTAEDSGRHDFDIFSGDSALEGSVIIQEANCDEKPSLALDKSKVTIDGDKDATFSVLVTSNDDASCKERDYDLDFEGSEGIEGELSSDHVSLKPGEQGSLTLKVGASIESGDRDFLIRLMPYNMTVKGTVEVRKPTECDINNVEISVSKDELNFIGKDRKQYTTISVKNTNAESCKIKYFVRHQFIEGFRVSKKPKRFKLSGGLSRDVNVRVIKRKKSKLAGDQMEMPFWIEGANDKKVIIKLNVQ